MRRARSFAVGAGALVLAVSAALTGVGAEPSSASPGREVRHHREARPKPRPEPQHRAPKPVTLMLGRRGPAFTSFGFDVKQDGVAGELYDHQTLAPTPMARAVFGGGRIGIIRFPIYAGASAFSNGRTTYPGYAHYLNAVHAAQQVDPDVEVFASLVTVCPGNETRCLEFDRSLKSATDGPIDPSAYGSFLAGYLRMMDDHGAHVDYLGIDNEGDGGTKGSWVRTNNEGQISGDRFAATMDAVNADYDGALPEAVFNDSPLPDIPTLSKLTSRDWAKVAIVAHHYSYDRRQRLGGPKNDQHTIPYYLAQLDRLARVEHGKPIWNTEFHFTYGGTHRTEDDYAHAVVSMKALFDQLDDGGTGISWWDYLDPAFSGAVHSLEQEVVASLRAGGSTSAGGRPVPTTDDDGVDAGPGVSKFTTRGIVLGHDVLLWAVNATDHARTTLPVVLRKGTSASSAAIRVPNGRSVTAVQWRQAGRALRRTTGSTTVVHHTARVTFPAHSITLVRVVNVV